MTDIEERNAVIKSTMLGLEDHGCFTSMLQLTYGGAGQGFGGWVLGAGYTATFIQRTLEIAGVMRWEQLPGKPIRVRIVRGEIVAIGHYLEDTWLTPVAFFKGEKDGT